MTDPGRAKRILSTAACLACAALVTACAKQSRRLEVEVTVRYGDRLVRTVVPVECGRAWTEGGEVLTQQPSAGLPAAMPDGSVSINNVRSFCAKRVPADGGWVTSALQYWPIVWMDDPRRPRIIESYVSEQYFQSPHARIVPQSIRVRLSPADPRRPSAGAIYRAVAPFWGPTSSSRFRKRLESYCGVSVVAVARNGSEMGSLAGLKLRPIAPGSLPTVLAAQTPLTYPIFPMQLLDRGGELDPAPRLRPLAISPAGEAAPDPQEQARGFFRLYRTTLRARLRLVGDGAAIILGDTPLGDAERGAYVIPATHCNRSPES